MARFDVYAIDGGALRVVDVQADLLRDLRTRVVIPLASALDAEHETAKRLRPRLLLEDGVYVLNTPELAVVPCSRLGACIESLTEQRETIIDAIDFLLQGF